jgi:hypothetical protein
MINVDISVYLLMISVDVTETKNWLGQYFDACRQQVYTYDASNNPFHLVKETESISLKLS